MNQILVVHPCAEHKKATQACLKKAKLVGLEWTPPKNNLIAINMSTEYIYAALKSGVVKVKQSLGLSLLVLLFCTYSTNITAQLVEPNFVNVDSYSGSANDVTVTMPTGSVVGDVVLVYVVQDDDDNNIVDEGGAFTELYNFFRDGNGPRTALFYRVIDGTEAPTYIFDLNNEPGVVATLRYQNLDPVMPFMAQSNGTGDSNMPLAPSVTTTRANTTYLQFIGIDGASAGVLTSTSGSSTVVVAAESNNSGGQAEMIIVSELQTTAGATPVGTFSFSTDEWTAITLALNSYSIETTAIAGTACPAGTSSYSVAYDLGASSGTLELVDPSGTVLTTIPYSSATGTATFNFTLTSSGTYTVRDQAIQTLTATATFLVDSDNDSVCDDVDQDSDNDGITDAVEDSYCLDAECDQDGDGIPNKWDLDSDGDGIPDNVEAQTTTGYTSPNNDSPAMFAANNGVNSAYPGGITPENTDTGSTPDFLNTDSDSDRIPDVEESGLVVTGLAAPNGLDEGVKTSDDYSDVNGVVNNPDTDLAKVTTNTTEVDYRDKQPPPQITICYNNNGSKTLGGTTMTFHDEKLLNPNNYGENGFAYFDMVLVNMGSGQNITAPQLVANGCQIFFMGGSGSGGATSVTEFSPTALDALRDWGQSPNNVIIAFQGPAIAMGGTEMVNGVETNKFNVTGGNRNPNTLTELGENVISGEFGQTGPFNQGGSFQGHFDRSPENACAFSQDNSSPMLPTGLLNSETGDFYMSDYGLVEELGGVSNSADILTNNDRLFANLMASAAKVVVEGPSDVCSFFLCPAGEEAPSPVASNVSSAGTPIDLNPLYTGTPPPSTMLTWHTASPPADDNYIGNSTSYTESGVVFAAYRADDGSCYSPPAPVMVMVNYPDLEVTIAPDTEASAAGEVQSFIVTVTNNGPISAPDAQVKVPIPTTRQLVLASPSLGTYNGSTSMWDVGPLTLGQSATLNIQIRLQ